MVDEVIFLKVNQLNKNSLAYAVLKCQMSNIPYVINFSKSPIILMNFYLIKYDKIIGTLLHFKMTSITLLYKHLALPEHSDQFVLFIVYFILETC